VKIVVASGKGGTGKSMLASSLSLLFSEIKSIVACDCDVDAPNLGLWLGVTAYDSVETISTSERAKINSEKCTGCGKCFDNCAFGAIEKINSKFAISHDIMILDAAAGIGCPVIASITGCDYAVLITEPTPSGFSDLERVLEIVNHFKVPYGIVLNKWDINPEVSRKIEEWSGEKFLGRISYDREVVNSIVNLKPVIVSKSKVKEEIREIFEKIRGFI